MPANLPYTSPHTCAGAKRELRRRLTGAIEAAFTGALMGIGLGLYNDDDQERLTKRALGLGVIFLSGYVWYASVFLAPR